MSIESKISNPWNAEYEGECNFYIQHNSLEIRFVGCSICGIADIIVSGTVLLTTIHVQLQFIYCR